MTPKTQSVCELCKAGIARNGKAHFRDGEFIGWCKGLYEPVSEPASTGEPPPESVKLVGTRQPTEAEIEYGKTLDPMAKECLERNKARMEPAARPSEPSAPQTAGKCWKCEAGLPHEWQFCEPAPQASAEPLLTQSQAVSAGMKRYWAKRKAAAPQPVSGDAPDMNDPRYCGACKHIHPPHEVDCRCYCDKVNCTECGPRIAARIMADPAPSPTPSVSTTTQEQPIICGNCGPTAFKITYDGTLGLILKCVTCGEQKLIELPVAAAPSVAGTQPTPDKMQQEMAGLRFRIHNLERHNQYFFRCESAWCHPADKQFQNPALETFKEALAISAGAAQGTPQVEEVASELLDAMETCHICHSYLVLQEFPVHCEDCSSDCENHDGGECTPIYVLHAKLRKLLKLATPASTARTDGWVDAKVRLPKAPETNDDPEFVYVKWTEAARWSGDEDEDNPRSASGYDTCLIAYLLENPKLISHWRELPAAPGSVPQAEPPKCLVCKLPKLTVHGAVPSGVAIYDLPKYFCNCVDGGSWGLSNLPPDQMKAHSGGREPFIVVNPGHKRECASNLRIAVTQGINSGCCPSIGQDSKPVYVPIPECNCGAAQPGDAPQKEKP